MMARRAKKLLIYLKNLPDKILGGKSLKCGCARYSTISVTCYKHFLRLLAEIYIEIPSKKKLLEWKLDGRNTAEK